MAPETAPDFSEHHLSLHAERTGTPPVAKASGKRESLPLRLRRRFQNQWWSFALVWMVLLGIPLGLMLIQTLGAETVPEMMSALGLTLLYGISSLGILLLLKDFDGKSAGVRVPESQESLFELHLKCSELEGSLEEKATLLGSLEREKAQALAELEQQKEAFAGYRTHFDEDLARGAASIAAAQEKIAELEQTLERRNKRIVLLEKTARDLNYQLRTVLRLGDIGTAQGNRRLEHRPTRIQTTPTGEEVHIATATEEVKSQYEAYILLQRCLQMAQALTGRYQFDVESKPYQRFAPSTHAIDLRRLFDRLRGEEGATVLVYSREEKRLLFVNPMVQELLGWAPERVIKDFSAIVKKGWDEQVERSAVGKETSLRLVMRHKNGKELQVQGCLGVVPSGAFQGLTIGVIYKP